MTKKLATALIITSFCLPPAIAFAQAQPPPGGPPGMAPPPGHRDSTQMRQIHEQMDRIHRDERAAVLGALTPAHRELLANIVGQMAVSERPNPRAAAARLDAALTPGERSAILSAHKTALDQMHAAIQQAMGSNAPRVARQPRHTPTAGEIAMRVAGPDHGMMFMHRGGPMDHPKPPSS